MTELSCNVHGPATLSGYDFATVGYNRFGFVVPMNKLRDRNSQNAGFTLVELMVSIAIIGVLAGLLLPAIQSARETARRMQCQSHLRQIGVALHNYHTAYGAFPAGYCSRTDSAGVEVGPGWSWATALLPYIEQSSLFSSIQSTVAIDHPVHDKIRIQRIPLYLCPSDVTPSTWEVVNRNPATGAFIANICRTGPANYVGMFGTFEPGVDGDGMLFRDRQLSFRDVTDGTSSTLFVGERSFRLGEATWAGAITNAVIVPDGSDGIGTGPAEFASSLILSHSGDGYGPGDRRSHVNQFFSNHTGGVQFLFVDGHVSFISSTTDYKTYVAISTRANGESVQSDF